MMFGGYLKHAPIEKSPADCRAFLGEPGGSWLIHRDEGLAIPGKSQCEPSHFHVLITIENVAKAGVGASPDTLGEF